MTNKIDVIIFTCFEAYEPRIEYIKNFFEKQEKTVLIISTDYYHREKQFRKDQKDNFIFITTKPYKKNLSIKRMYSHYFFAKDAFAKAMEYSPELIYVLIPGNALAKFAVAYKKKKNCKLIIDVVDLWPESLPFHSQKIFLLDFWRKLRNDSLVDADLVITECELYKKSFPLQVQMDCHTVYWPQKAYTVQLFEQQEEKYIHFLYLGSINNIIDIQGIIALLNKMKRYQALMLHIVGGGEKKDVLIKGLEDNGIVYKDYGFVYDHTSLVRIAKMCYWGINMMKSTVHIGLTMKSVSYLELGIPIINSLKGDTWEFVEQYQVGYNITCNLDCKVLLPSDRNQQMRKNSRKLFETHFSEEAFEKQLEQAVSFMRKDGGDMDYQ